MKSKKIINDPVHGFITIPYPILLEIIDHPWFQRLRRIRQLGLTDFVYPGAIHTRLHHAIGAMHLMHSALTTLRSKGVEVSDQEMEASCCAILMHDCGHGPFSHALENLIVPHHHEELSLAIMHAINDDMGGGLDLAIQIFKNEHPKLFLHQLINSQLDMDRMDYLIRDSFFTGVSEGVIGHDRIIKMLNVVDNKLVVEEKGLYSIEKFLIARKLMYWQVYLHKTVLSAELMLQEFYKSLLSSIGEELKKMSTSRLFELIGLVRQNKFKVSNRDHLDLFCKIDDYDLYYSLKSAKEKASGACQYLSNGLLDRKLFKLVFISGPNTRDFKEKVRHIIEQNEESDKDLLQGLVFEGEETTTYYQRDIGEIQILTKQGSVINFSQKSDFGMVDEVIVKRYLCYPKPPSIC